MKIKPWMIALGCGLVLAGCAGKTITEYVDDPSFDQEQEWSDGCRSNVKQLAVAMNIYLTDYDDVFPAPGWDGVAGYYKSSRITACPRNYVHGEQHFNYAMSQELIGQNMTALDNISTTPLLFEVDADTPFLVESFANILKTPRHKGDIWWAAADSSVHAIGSTP